MKVLLYMLLLTITLFPKITIISVGNSSTGIRIEDLLILMCTMFLFLYGFKTKKNRIDENKHKFYKIRNIMFIYLIVCIISMFYGVIKGYVAPITSLLFIIRRFEYFLLCYFGYQYGLKDNKNESKYLNFIVLFHTGVCLLQMTGLVGSFNHGEMLSTLTQGRISSTFNGAYEMSAFLLIILPYYIYNLLFEKKILKNLIYISLITMCIIMSASRTSLILECFIFVYMLIKNNILQNKRLLQNFIIFSIFVIAPVMLFIIPKIDFSRYINLSMDKNTYIIKYTWYNRNFINYVKTGSWYGNSNYTPTQIAMMGYDDSLYVRVSHWMQLLDGWVTSPIIGVGVSIAGAACDGNYIKILTETGILGLIVWLYLLYVIRKSLIESKWLKFSFVTIVLGALLIDLFDASKVMMFFWFLLGIYICRENIFDVKKDNIK